MEKIDSLRISEVEFFFSLICDSKNSSVGLSHCEWRHFVGSQVKGANSSITKKNVPLNISMFKIIYD
jgi:hypothetical protein